MENNQGNPKGVVQPNETQEDKEVLIGHRNSFRATLIAATLNVKRYRFIKTIKPDFQKQDKQGKYVGIDELIEDDERKAANAKSLIRAACRKIKGPGP